MNQKTARLRRACASATLLVAGLGLGACTQSAGTASPPSLGPTAFSAPTGGGCAGEIARFRAVLKNDVDTGNVGQSVYNRATADLGRGDAACAAGRQGEALSVLAATKSRFGYR